MFYVLLVPLQIAFHSRQNDHTDFNSISRIHCLHCRQLTLNWNERTHNDRYATEIQMNVKICEKKQKKKKRLTPFHDVSVQCALTRMYCRSPSNAARLTKWHCLSSAHSYKNQISMNWYSFINDKGSSFIGIEFVLKKKKSSKEQILFKKVLTR